MSKNKYLFFFDTCAYSCGKVVWNHVAEKVEGNQSIALPAPTITSGIYLIRVDCEGRAPHISRWVRN